MLFFVIPSLLWLAGKRLLTALLAIAIVLIGVGWFLHMAFIKHTKTVAK
jgi:uncharacterized membrane protein